MLEVGERLFGIDGIEGTTTRQICREAGVHQDAIHYHFGTKDDFVGAILEANIHTLEHHLARRLTEAQRRADDPPLVALARAAVASNTDMANEEGLGRHYMSFLAAVLADVRLRSLALGRPSSWNDRMVAALTPLTPGLSEIERVYRVAVAGFLLVNVMMERPKGGLIGEWMSTQGAPTEPILHAMLVDAVAGVLGAPSLEGGKALEGEL